MEWLNIEYFGDTLRLAGATSNWHTRSNWNPSIIPDGQGKKATFDTVCSGNQTLVDNVTLQFLVFNNTTGIVTINTATGKVLYFSSKPGTGNCVISGTTNRANVIAVPVGLFINLDITANGGSLAFTDVISGSFNISKSGSNTLLLSATNTFIGTVTGVSGTITISNNNAFGNSANVVTLNGSPLNISGILSVPNPFVISTAFTLAYTGTSSIDFTGAVSGSAGITVNNASGTFTLSGTYSAGAIALNLGSLIISGTHSGTSNITTAAGSILLITGSITSSTGTITGPAYIKGTGTCAKAITQNGASIIEPGNGGVGTLTLTNTYGMSSAGNYSIRTSGATASKIAVTGNVTIRGTYSLPDSSLTAGTYDIVTYTGTATVTTLTSNGINNTGRTITFFHDTVNKKYQMIAV